MGASGWNYFVPYQPDLGQALEQLRKQVFADGDFWWAQARELGKSSADRPTTMEELFAQPATRRDGTHSILDMHRLAAPPERPSPGTIEPVTRAQALATTGTATPTREHARALNTLAGRRGHGRCAVLHDEEGAPTEIYFFGWSGC